MVSNHIAAVLKLEYFALFLVFCCLVLYLWLNKLHVSSDWIFKQACFHLPEMISDCY